MIYEKIAAEKGKSSTFKKFLNDEAVKKEIQRIRFFEAGIESVEIDGNKIFIRQKLLLFEKALEMARRIKQRDKKSIAEVFIKVEEVK